MPAAQAINAPRIHCVGSEIFVESRVPTAVLDALRAKGHKVTVKGDMDLYFGGAQAVLVNAKTRTLYGGADPRRDGFAVGY